MDAGYYISRERKLTKEFDRTLDRIRGLFVSHIRMLNPCTAPHSMMGTSTSKQPAAIEQPGLI